MTWLDTYRGTVHRWEVDNVDHFTVAYYFARFEDAALGLLREIRLDPGALAGSGQFCATLGCHVRYLRELRVGDILHIQSGVIEVADTGLAIGHRVFDSGDGALCTTVEQRVALVEVGRRTPLPLDPARRALARARSVEWTPVEVPPPRMEMAPLDGLGETARDTIKTWEVDTLGQAAFPAYIHRFSAANGHMLASFGVTPAYMRSERRGFSTFEFRLSFSGALRAGEFARVRSGLLHVGNSSMRLLHRMDNLATGEEVAALEQAGVHLDIDARRPTPLPAAIRDRARTKLVVASAEAPGG